MRRKRNDHVCVSALTTADRDQFQKTGIDEYKYSMSAVGWLIERYKSPFFLQIKVSSRDRSFLPTNRSPTPTTSIITIMVLFD